MAKHVNSGNCPKCKEMLYATTTHPDLMQWFIDIQASSPEVHISYAYRGKADQDKFFREGKSKAKFGQSPHNYKPTMAIDLFFLVDGKADFSMTKYKAIAEDMPNELEWGGSWKFRDGPHFEVRGWKNLIENYPNGDK